MKLDKTKYEDDKMDQQKEEEERLLIVMVTFNHFSLQYQCDVRCGGCEKIGSDLKFES